MFIPTATAPTQEAKVSKQIDNGTYFARITQIIDLGTQTTEWKGTVSTSRQFRIVFETVDELYEFSKEKGEQPYLLSKDVKYIVSKPDTAPDKVSSLTKILRACGIDTANSVNIFTIINKICQIETNQNDKGYATIINFTALPKSAKSLEFPVFNDPKIFYFDNFDQTKECFESQPSFIKDKIMASPEYKEILEQKQNKPLPNQDFTDDLPEIDINTVNMPF